MLEIVSPQVRQLEAFRADVGFGLSQAPKDAAEPMAL